MILTTNQFILLAAAQSVAVLLAFLIGVWAFKKNKKADIKITDAVEGDVKKKEDEDSIRIKTNEWDRLL